jgi:hypothetical protein
MYGSSSTTRILGAVSAIITKKFLSVVKGRVAISEQL